MKVEVMGSGKLPYIVDTEQVTCSCPNWKYRCSHFPMENPGRQCKHLQQVFEEHPEYLPYNLKVKSQIESNGSPDADGKIRYPRVIFDAYVAYIRSLMSNNTNIVKNYEICGSYRRLAERVSDLDVLIILQDGAHPDGLFNQVENIGSEKLWRGEKKASYKLDGIIQVDFKVVPEESWAFSVCHFTGSKSENIRLRRLALNKGYSLSEYGLKDNDGVMHQFDIKSEQDLYNWLGTPYKYPWDR